MQVEPEVRLMPNLLGGLPRLECHFGWSEEANHILKENDFDVLVLSGGEGQDFKIPDLGANSQKVLSLRLMASGVINGLNQFEDSLVSLDIMTVPSNGVEIKDFPHIQHLSLEWDKKIEAQVHEIESLTSLFIRFYKYKNIDKLNCLNNLKKLSLSQGAVASIKGINLNLESLDLSYLKNFTDIDTINDLTNIRRIDCQNIKKAQGVVKLNQFKKANFIRFVDTGCTLDFEGINHLHDLEKIWSNGEHINVNWEQIIALPKLKIVGLIDSMITDDEIKLMAQKASKKIENLTRAGTKKAPHIQITFDS